MKLQVTGPVTLAHALGDAALVHELAVWLAANAAGQVGALRERGLDALLVVDEPALHLMGDDSARGLASLGGLAQRARPPARRQDAWDSLRAIAPAWGLHLCGPVPWDVVERAEPDVLSFDLTLAPADERVLAGIVARGGRIAWGLIPPHRSEHVAQLPCAHGAHSLLTASCGTGRMSLRRELEIAAALRAVRPGS